MTLFKVSLSLGIELASFMTRLCNISCRRWSVLVQPVCQLNSSAMTATCRGNRRLQERRALVLAQPI